MKNKEETVTAGILSDSVKEIINISLDDIEPPPEISMAIDSDFISGWARRMKNSLSL